MQEALLSQAPTEPGDPCSREMSQLQSCHLALLCVLTTSLSPATALHESSSQGSKDIRYTLTCCPGDRGGVCLEGTRGTENLQMGSDGHLYLTGHSGSALLLPDTQTLSSSSLCTRLPPTQALPWSEATNLPFGVCLPLSSLLEARWGVLERKRKKMGRNRSPHLNLGIQLTQQESKISNKCAGDDLCFMPQDPWKTSRCHLGCPAIFSSN